MKEGTESNFRPFFLSFGLVAPAFRVFPGRRGAQAARFDAVLGEEGRGTTIFGCPRAPTLAAKPGAKPSGNRGDAVNHPCIDRSN
ncbi:hypothetical protein [Ralstonia sp. AU12-08]|uniref:hypothetical protein n=1 Tax=Ralstonia sp. AU12-08 TaxID=1235457 RepID=UPI00126856CA|nr:hypothetical protein [Ralstonia sp. AU12-08]